MYIDREIVVKDAAYLAAHKPEEFCMARRYGYGASDCATLCEMSHFDTIQELMLQKKQPMVTEEEKRVSNLPQVRKGTDLEHVVLDKFEQWYSEMFVGVATFEVYKPAEMFKLKDTCLTVNYDGWLQLMSEDMADANEPGIYRTMPVECKVISRFGRKYWDWDNDCTKTGLIKPQTTASYTTMKQKITEQAAMVGVPDYYYLQCQQQLMGVDGKYAYLCAIDDDKWEFHVFIIKEDEEIQQFILEQSKLYNIWEEEYGQS